MSDLPEPTPRRGPGRPPTGGPTPTRSLRIGATWDQATAIAKRRGETLTSVIEAGLRRYIARHRNLLNQQLG